MLEDCTSGELCEAFTTIEDSVIANKLLEVESKLLMFLYYMKLQEELLDILII